MPPKGRGNEKGKSGVGTGGNYESLETEQGQSLYTNQTKTVTCAEWGDFQDDSGNTWICFPPSVIGTLLYFLFIEQNSPNFDLFTSVKAMILIGFSTFMTYCLQFVVIYGLYLAVWAPTGDDGENSISDSICIIDRNLLLAAICVFWISMWPSFTYILQELDIIMFSKRVAYTQDIKDGTDDADVFITNILCTPSKRLFIFLFVNLIEMCVVIATCIVGVGYLLSSDGVENLLMNSVSIVFIVQIDDMARDAFQNPEISEHIDGMLFETTFTKLRDDDKSKSHRGIIRPPKWSTYQTFWAIEKACFSLILSALSVYPVWYYYCIMEGWEYKDHS